MSVPESIPAITVVVCLAWLLDRLVGEPVRFHPLAGFGAAAAWLENRLLAPAGTIADPGNSSGRRRRGIVACFLLIVPPVFAVSQVVWLTGENGALRWTLEVLILYLATGARSLVLHARRVALDLTAGGLRQARSAAGMLVSRDTSRLDETGICRATAESVLENGNDAIFAPCFWYLVAGIPGVVAYRLVNTLDAMWGYRNEKYLDFGRTAARLDDLLNWLPARLTALTYAMAGQFTVAIDCWRSQARYWDSPNAGPVMASGAGALALELGGGAFYHGRWRDRPLLGRGRPPAVKDIERTIKLLYRTMLIWILLITATGIILTGGGL